MVRAEAPENERDEPEERAARERLASCCLIANNAPVPTRRFLLAILAAPLIAPFLRAAQVAWAQARTVLPKGTPRESLISKDPAHYDPRNLDITPIEQFGTMGTTDREVNMTSWRLDVGGKVKHPLSLSYSQLTALPTIERDVLLICPGFFANYGRWKGISIRTLLTQAEFETNAAWVSIESAGSKAARFALADVLSNKVFLAYGVNGKPLPKANGFPLRVVADGVFGSDWVKYVDRITVEM